MVVILLVVPTLTLAETRTYGVAHIGIKKSNETSKHYQVIDRSSYIGLKGVSALDNGIFATYKFELGFDITNHSSSRSKPNFRYSFLGIKSDIGEIRFGRQDSAYDIVDNSMSYFFSKQGNGLITENHPDDLISFNRKFNDIGLYVSHKPSNQDKQSRVSAMLNYASDALYVGIAYLKEKKAKQEGFKFVVTYKKNNYGLGFIHEKCPSSQSLPFDELIKRGCTADGMGSINHVSAKIRFGKPYIAAQIARNSDTGLDKRTLELGSTLGLGTKAYFELDKTDSVITKTLGLISYF